MGFWPTLIQGLRHDAATSGGARAPLGASPWELLVGGLETLNADLLEGLGMAATLLSTCERDVRAAKDKLFASRSRRRHIADEEGNSSELLDRIEKMTEERDVALASRDAFEAEALQLREVLTRQRGELERRLQEAVASRTERDVSVENVTAKANRLVAELKATRERLAEAEKYVERCLLLEAQFSWELVEVEARGDADAVAEAQWDDGVARRRKSSLQ